MCKDQISRTGSFAKLFGWALLPVLIPLILSPLTASAQQPKPQFDVTKIKALSFDVFGTVVDWRGSIIREGQLLSADKGYGLDWGEFADQWRAGYGPAMNRVRTGEMPWTKLDDLHRMILDELVIKYELEDLSADDLTRFNNAWHRLSPWPDTLQGLVRLKTKYIITTLSNGNVSLLTNMAKNAGLPWDAILSAELAGHYKPDPRAYLKAAELLSLEPNEILMVATHPSDLRAAAKAGLRTAYVIRPLERGPNREVNTNPEGDFDIIATDFLDLARQLGVEDLSGLLAKHKQFR